MVGGLSPLGLTFGSIIVYVDFLGVVMKQLTLFNRHDYYSKENEMPKVTGSYPHSLDSSTVKKQMEFALEDLLTAFEMQDISVNKEDTSFSFQGVSRGVSTKGSIEIEESMINVTIELPFSAIAFKGRVQNAIDKRVPPFLEV